MIFFTAYSVPSYYTILITSKWEWESLLQVGNGRAQGIDTWSLGGVGSWSWIEKGGGQQGSRADFAKETAGVGKARWIGAHSEIRETEAIR